MNKAKYTELINQLTDRELLKNVYITQFILLMVAFGLHIIVFRSNPPISNIFEYELTDFIIGIVAGVAIVVMDIWLMIRFSGHYHDDGGVNKRIFQNRHPFHIAFIALIVAFSEEVLFRGVIQTNIGLFLSCLLFAILHYRYLFNPLLFVNVVFVSIVIGLLFEVTENLWVTVIMHFLIDFLLGCIIRFKIFQKKISASK
ncbi:type II CAAX endopeptidase family protein [Niallia sp.]|uniref:CPBP family intramembrane glutamic endopeptidase n=1 Tax=Niallia sp. TaxID=2837523 RepID=UPI00289FEEC5|nr:type II CAAX endopeptidase family protein [Niallia sp.]